MRATTQSVSSRCPSATRFPRLTSARWRRYSRATLEAAINLGGGDYEKLARHAVAGLISSVDVNYPYTAAFVLQQVHNAFLPGGSAEPLATQLAAANDLNH